MASPKYVEKITLEQRSSMAMSSPFKDAEIAFNWLNRDYPIYHEHTHWELFVVLAGKISHTVNGEEYVMKKGDACIIRPSDKHSLAFQNKQWGRDYQQINFTFSNDFAQKLLEVYERYEDILQEEKSLQFSIDDSEIATIYDKALLTQNLPQANYEMSSKLILMRIITLFFEQRMLFDTAYPTWLNEFVVYINNPSTFDKSTKELAATTPYSYSRLSTLFKQYVGTTIVDYMNEKKMIYAKRLLRTTRLTTLQISEMIGYNSLSSFNHLFKDTFGITPSRYRKEKQVK